jgi:prephenate dehydrogenase
MLLTTTKQRRQDVIDELVAEECEGSFKVDDPLASQYQAFLRQDNEQLRQSILEMEEQLARMDEGLEDEEMRELEDETRDAKVAIDFYHGEDEGAQDNEDDDATLHI